MSQSRSIGWRIFSAWEPPARDALCADSRPEPGPEAWIAVGELVEAHDRALQSAEVEYHALLAEWDSRLVDLGRDPTHTPWSNFRPLRVSREEDWSDWLGFLLETSETGVTAGRLFGAVGDSLLAWARPRTVWREPAHDGYRADLVIEWRSGLYDHVEVKVGDPHLEKTHATGAAMRSRFAVPPSEWRDSILLLDDQLGAWAAAVSASTGEPPVAVMTWVDVGAALRRGLIAEESSTWRAWAYAFVGAIEEVLLGFRPRGTKSHRLYGIEAKIRSLREGLAND